ncbi:2-polyprenyl-6-methoxyphenol hydroxylase-like FAD-dependent oxidoreductase [Catenulispora sp. EB89]|uniref:FAD-dependent monooxygenase n=1 Tax=Catenulispora sp. EB89 TaxID=3156257 RepID=UPI003510FFCD
MKTAMVVGGGIAGLTTAIGLRRVGWQVRVLERAAVLHDAGAGISVQGNGMRSLDVLGVGDAVRAAGEPQGSGGIRVPGGKWLSHMDAEAGARLLGSPVYSFLRADLHRALRSALPEDCLVTGATVHRVVRKADAAEVCFSRAGAHESEHESETVDLVVAADGVHSRVRAQLFPNHPGAVHGGSTVWRGVTSVPVDTEADIDQTWGRGTEFGSTRLLDGRIEWHASITSAEGDRHGDPLAEVARRFGTWHAPIPALLAATPPGTVLEHDVYELRTPLPSYVADRVVLVGDAAHAMAPHLGQGVSQAVEDAACLAAYLTADPTIEAALAHYDRERRPRTQEVVRASRQAGRVGQQLHGRLAVALRNAGIRATPSSVALKAMVKHALWEPPPLG